MNLLRTTCTQLLFNNAKYIRYQVTTFRHHQNEASLNEDENIIKDKDRLKKVESKRLLEFRKKLNEEITDDDDDPFGSVKNPNDPLPPWPNNTNPHTGEIGGPRGPEPTRYGDWERKGICIDF